MADDGFTLEQREILERWANLEIEDKEAISSLSPNGLVHLRHSSKYDAYTLKCLENEKKKRANEWYTRTSNIRAELVKKIDTDDDVENAVNLALQKLDDWAELKLSNDELSEYIGYAIRSPFRNNTVFSKYLLTHLRNKLKGADCNTEKDDTKGMIDNTIKDNKFISFLTEFQARLNSLSEFVEGYLSESEKDFEEHCADLYKKGSVTEKG